MTYIVKAFCLLVLFVALEIGTEAQQTKPPLDISINKDCYGERCFKGQQCCGPIYKCQQCCRNQHCLKGQICRYIFLICSILLGLLDMLPTLEKKYSKG